MISVGKTPLSSSLLGGRLLGFSLLWAVLLINAQRLHGQHLQCCRSASHVLLFFFLMYPTHCACHCLVSEWQKEGFWKGCYWRQWKWYTLTYQCWQHTFHHSLNTLRTSDVIDILSIGSMKCVVWWCNRKIMFRLEAPRAAILCRNWIFISLRFLWALFANLSIWRGRPTLK